MKRITTFLCSLCFMAAGIGLAIAKSNSATIQAAPVINLPPITTNDLPLDLQLDLQKRTDTVTVHVHDTVFIAKPKRKTTQAKKHKGTNPDTIPSKVKQDTLYVPALYIVIPVENLHNASSDTLLVTSR